MGELKSANQSRQPTPGVRLAAYRASLAPSFDLSAAGIRETPMQLSPHFEERRKELDNLWHVCSASPENFAVMEKVARKFQKDFPDQIVGYQATMMLVEYATPEKAMALAQEMADTAGAPIGIRSWATGFLYRTGLKGKLVDIHFTALDGREVNVAEMKGKGTLVDFWGPGCRACVRAIPLLKALRNTLKQQGFEIVGIACAEDPERLVKFIREEEIDWPQHFEGRRDRTQNTMTRRFGINGIPHMFLLDKKGRLRQDNLRADTNLEDLVAQVLRE